MTLFRHPGIDGPFEFSFLTYMTGNFREVKCSHLQIHNYDKMFTDRGLSAYIIILQIASVNYRFVGQFFHKGVEIDEMHKSLFLPGKAPVPVEWRPVWRFMERSTEEKNMQHCWASMNPGNQGKGLIDGYYLDYLVEDVLTSGFVLPKTEPTEIQSKN